MSAMQSPNGRGGEDCAAGRSTRLDRVRVPSVPLRDKRGFAALEGQFPKEYAAAIRIAGQAVEFFGRSSCGHDTPRSGALCQAPARWCYSPRVGALTLSEARPTLGSCDAPDHAQKNPAKAGPGPACG